MKLSRIERQFISNAASYLELNSYLGFLTKTTNIDLEKAVRFMPKQASEKIMQATEMALREALITSISQSELDTETNEMKNRIEAAATGALSGYFGIWGLIYELPRTLSSILKNSMKVSENYGYTTMPEEQDGLRNLLECFCVFAYGSNYLDTRVNTYVLIDDVVKDFYQCNASEFASAVKLKASTSFEKLFSFVMTKIQTTVMEKALLQSVPVIGAIGGATANASFVEYYMQLAKYHVGILRLERDCGENAVQTVYSSFRIESVKQAA